MNQNIIKKETEQHFLSEGKQEIFAEKIEKLKSDIICEIKKYMIDNPGKTFFDYKEYIIRELELGFEFLDQIIYVGLFLNALDLIDPLKDL